MTVPPGWALVQVFANSAVSLRETDLSPIGLESILSSVAIVISSIEQHSMHKNLVSPTTYHDIGLKVNICCLSVVTATTVGYPTLVVICYHIGDKRRTMLQEQCDRLDPRVRRTRQLLQDALRRLLEQKGFDNISVQDITEAATLNRATFCAHYPDKFALLEELIRVSFLQLLAQRNVRFDSTCSSAVKAIILTLCDYLVEVQKSHSSDRLQFKPFVEATVIDQIRLVLLEAFRLHPQ